MRVEKTLLETSKRLEREQLGLQEGAIAAAPQTPHSLSKVALTPSLSQNCSPALVTPIEGQASSTMSLIGSNSGLSTPATALSPTHLQNVREQMAAALKQLKELEEQVKTIPVLEMKICQLKEEKEHLTANLGEKVKHETDEAFIFKFPPSSPHAEATGLRRERSRDSHEAESETKVRLSKIAELKKLTEKLSVSERGTKSSASVRRVEEQACKSVGVGEEKDMNEVVFYYQSQKPCRDVAVGQTTETRDAAVWVMESLLGVSAETEEELQILQDTVAHQRQVIALLEGHLREATEELEELRVAVCSRMPRELISRETMAQPRMAEAGVEAAPETQCRAVDGHVDMVDKSVHCSPQMACVGVGCSLQLQDFVEITRVDPGMESDASEQSIDTTLAERGPKALQETKAPTEAGIKECGIANENLLAELPCLPMPTVRNEQAAQVEGESAGSPGAGGEWLVQPKSGPRSTCTRLTM